MPWPATSNPLPIPRISRNYLAFEEMPSPMRERSMNRRLLNLVLPGSLIVLALVASGCATRPQTQQQAAAAEEDFHDPLEDTNRKIFEFNQVVDKHVLVPVAKTYRAVIPDPVRNSIRDFLNNLQSPLIFVNDTLQGDFRRAKDTVVRFVLNSTIGMAGIVDVAGRWGIPYHEQDLGVTLGVWGVPEGPYLVIPILGPADPRDLGGEVAQGFADPFNIIVSGNPWTLYWIPYVRGAVAGVDQRARYLDTLADIERTSLDYYATIRSLYRQRRAALIRGDRKNLPPPSGFSQNGAPTTPAAPTNPELSAPTNPSPPAIVVSAIHSGSEVSGQ
jgi:phospholipid-binding lipoprotein MlaA